jgi:YVTN family beta-propeller protein
MGGEPMKRRIFIGLVALSFVFATAVAWSQQPRFKVLAFYSTNVEPDHVQFAEDALKFFAALASEDNFAFDVTSDWGKLNAATLKNYDMVVWLNDSPQNSEQRAAFERFAENGGGWLGFHFAGYNDESTNWPWFVNFLGGAVFYSNNWPPLPAKLAVDDKNHPVTAGLPEAYDSPANEWYVWKPSPRLNKDVRVLLTLDSSNYPLGFKDVLESGDLPVVWTNTKYRMLYLNMGHGDKIFTSSTQNQLIEQAINWLGSKSPQPAAEPNGIRISPRAIEINPKTNRVYAVNTHNSTVTVLSAGHSPSQIKVGAEPVAIAINSSTNRIYIANAGSGNVTVVDGANDKVVATVPVGDLPYAIAVNPVTNRIYVAKTFSNTITVIDGATNVASVLKDKVGADAIAVNPITNRVYFTGYESQAVTELDGATDHTSAVKSGDHVWAIAVNPVSNKIFATNVGKASVAVIDGKTDEVTFVKAGEIPSALAVDASNGRVYVANYGSGDVTVVDAATNAVIATVKVEMHPQAIAVDSKTHHVYVASTKSDTTTVIDGTNDRVLTTLKTPGRPYAIAVDSASNTAFVLGLTSGEVTVIDGATLRVSALRVPGE